MKTLYRSQRDKKIFGLCGGLAEALDVDVSLLRLVAVVTAFFSGGAVVFIYIVASLVIPKEPTHGDPFSNTTHSNPFGGSATNSGRGSGDPFGPSAYRSESGQSGHAPGPIKPEEPRPAASSAPSTPPMPQTVSPVLDHDAANPHHDDGADPKAAGPKAAEPNLDEQLKDVEVKALWREVEALRERLARYENGRSDEGPKRPIEGGFKSDEN